MITPRRAHQPPMITAGLAALTMLSAQTPQLSARPDPEPPSQETAPPAATTFAPDPWSRRASLDLSRPQSYFTLAEDFADLVAVAPSPADAARALAESRRLFILTARLASVRQSGEDSGLASSAYIALAALADNPDEARWLRAVADSVAPPPRSVRWEASPAILAADAGAYEVAVAFGRYRSGEFRRVRDALRRNPEGVALLARAGLTHSEATSLINEIDADSTRPNGCPRCKGERVIRGVTDAKPTVSLCPVCLGNPAPSPALTPERFNAQLRAEALLLGASPTTWSGQARIDHAAPFRDIDPAAVAARYGIDRGATVCRNGVWVTP